jgi:hypothetical protein
MLELGQRIDDVERTVYTISAAVERIEKALLELLALSKAADAS